jgi:hypothetical protein
VRWRSPPPREECRWPRGSSQPKSCVCEDLRCAERILVMPYKASRAAWTRLLRFRSQCQSAQVRAARWHACMDELFSGTLSTGRRYLEWGRIAAGGGPGESAALRTAISQLAYVHAPSADPAGVGPQRRSAARVRSGGGEEERWREATCSWGSWGRALRSHENFTPRNTHFPGRCASPSACGLLPRWSASARLRPANSAEFSDNCATSQIWAPY